MPPDLMRFEMWMHFARVGLHAPNGRLAELTAFYATQFATMKKRELGELRIGTTVLVFEDAPGNPFYHFAFLVPGDRFDAAVQWAQPRVDLLPDGESGDVVFDSTVAREAAATHVISRPTNSATSTRMFDQVRLSDWAADPALKATVACASGAHCHLSGARPTLRVWDVEASSLRFRLRRRLRCGVCRRSSLV
jgi:hypothetical protein